MKHERLSVGYIVATGLVQAAGYIDDIIWAEDLAKVKPDARYVMLEGSWVILNSGFRYVVARKLWPGIREAFNDFEPGRINPSCVHRALQVFRSRPKIAAMWELCRIVQAEGIARILADAQEPPRLCWLPYIGQVTCWHFAKVLGADVVKPDVHLTRAAAAAGMSAPLALCQAIQEDTGDRLTVIDSVLWRYGEQQKARGWPDWVGLWAGEAPGPARKTRQGELFG